MSDAAPRAVFLSYASQDVEAAQRIAGALRAAGVEVWFDKSELRGGDAWDAKLRRQIKECALFVPIITPNTNARAEGYFRLEWKLAVDRSHLMADDAHFLFPIVVGDVSDATARVPDKFRDVQWTRLRLDETPAELGARVAKILLGGDSRVESASAPAVRRSARNSHWIGKLGMILGLTIGLVYALRPLWSPARRPAPKPAVVAPAAPAAPVSEARQLLARARAMSLDKYNATAEDFAAAENLVKKALELDPNDAEIWAFSSLLNFSFGSRGFDHAPARVAAARSQAERALSLDPDSPEAQFALARWQRDNEEPAVAEASFKKILTREPNHIGALSGLAWIYDQTDRVDESAALSERIVTLPGSNPALSRYTEFLLFFHRARFEEADRCIRQSIATQPSANSLAGLANLLLTWKGDTDGAASVLASMPTAARSLPRTIWMTAQVQLCQRAPAETLQTLDRFSGDYIQDNFFSGPKTYWVGRAHALAGRKEAARLAWEAGLDVVNARLKTEAQSRELHLMRGVLLALLGSADEALREARAVEELARGRDRWWFSSSVLIYAALGLADDALPLLEKLRVTAPVEQNVGWPLTPAILRLDPRWDKIRDDPRFQKLCEEPAAAPSSLSLSPSTRSVADSKSVAVLAFANLSDDKANEYFSDGISEELLNVLAKVPGLKVTARTSSFHFKGTNTAIPEIAQQLGVAYVIEGSVRKQGDKVRITAQLIKAADGFHVWSDTFTRDLKDIFAVQDEIAGLIAKQLSLKLEASSPAATASVNPQAFELYVQARQALNRRDAENFDRAEQLLTRALDLEPGLARAHAALADVWTLRANLRREIGYFGQREAPVFSRIEAEVGKALAIDPDSAEAHASLGFARLHEWKLADAERELRRAVALNPNYPTGHHWLATCLTNIGWIDEGLAEYQRAAELDPFSFRILENYGSALEEAGRREESLAYLNRALQLQPKSTQALASKAITLSELNRRSEAIAIIRELPESNARFLFAGAGLKAEAEAALAKATGRDRNSLLAGLDRYNEWLDAITPADINVFGLRGLLFFEQVDPIRRDPRFTKLIATLGLTEAHARAQAWRQAHPPEKPKAAK